MNFSWFFLRSVFFGCIAGGTSEKFVAPVETAYQPAAHRGPVHQISKLSLTIPLTCDGPNFIRMANLGIHFQHQFCKRSLSAASAPVSSKTESDCKS